MNKKSQFPFSALLQHIDALSARGRNLAFRTVSTSTLASWTNRTISEVIGESVRQNDAQILQSAALAGCESLKLIQELEASESLEIINATPQATLPADKSFVIHQLTFTAARETAAPGNRYEQPMTLAQWLKFLIQNTQRDNSAALVEFAEVSGHDIKTIEYMDQQTRKMELERLDKAIPTLIDQFKIDTELLKEAKDVDLDIFNYFKLMLKVQLKLQKESMNATNRALRFTNLQFLEDAREYKQDAEAMQVLIDQFQKEYEEELMVWEEQIKNIMLAA